MEASTSVAEIVADLDDQSLRELAKAPAERLFPLLRHAAAMRPLVVLAAILPGLMVLPNSHLSSIRAILSLRSLDLLKGTFAEFVEIRSESKILFPGTAPLTSWLGVVWLDLFGTGLSFNFVLTQFLSITAIVGLTFVIGHRLGGMRMGLFSTLLVCSQPQILWGVRAPGLGPLPVALALVCLWSFHKLWQEQLSSFSLVQTTAGLSSALCALSGGPLIMALICCVMLNRIAWDLLLWIQDHTSATYNKRHRAFLRGWRSLAVSGVYVAIVSGGWFLWMMGTNGFSFIPVWFGPLFGSSILWIPDDWKGMNPEGETLTLIQFFPAIMSGFVLLGYWQAIREILGQSHEMRLSRRSECVWLVTWTSTAFLFWVIAEIFVGDQPPFIEMWRLFLIVPMTIAAAWGIVEIADRRVEIRTLLGLALFSILASLVQLRFAWSQHFFLINTATLVLAAIALAPVALWKVMNWSRRRTQRERQILSGITLSLMVLTISNGLLLLPRGSSDQTELQSLAKDLLGKPAVDSLIFVAQGPIAPELEFILRSRWPRASVSYVSDWSTGMARIVEHRSRGLHSAAEMLICWDVSESGRYKDLQNPVVVVPAVAPRLFRERELDVFLCEPDPETTP